VVLRGLKSTSMMKIGTFLLETSFGITTARKTPLQSRRRRQRKKLKMN
jgi:hypothetical protein